MYVAKAPNLILKLSMGNWFTNANMMTRKNKLKGLGKQEVKVVHGL